MELQFQSDILGVELRRPRYRETTSLGAVFAAGLGAGIWKNISDVSRSWREERTFKPAIDDKAREQALKGWHQAIARVNLDA